MASRIKIKFAIFLLIYVRGSLSISIIDRNASATTNHTQFFNQTTVPDNSTTYISSTTRPYFTKPNSTIFFTTTNATNLKQAINGTQPEKLVCKDNRGTRIPDRTKEMNCCRQTYAYFKRRWLQGGTSLAQLLQTLKDWNCTEYTKECNSRFFSFTPFTKLIYERFCNRTAFEDTCLQNVKEYVEKNENSLSVKRNFTRISFDSLIERLGNIETHSLNALPPCVQASLYDTVQPYGGFHELITVFLPFCGIVWCGIDSQSVNNKGTSLWMCATQGCRSGLIATIVVTVLLSLIITLTNGCVVYFIARNKGLRNSQGIYKLSLACADCMIGVIVLPSFGYTLHRIATRPQQLGPSYNTTDAMGNIVTSYKAGGFFRENFTASYFNGIGFFTTLSISVSITTLMLASFDRLAVVRKPLKYHLDDAKELAVKCVAVLWVFMFVIALLPIVLPTLNYRLVASILMAPGGPYALYMYLVQFAVPLLLMWATSLSTCGFTFNHSRGRDHTVEWKLAKTLSIMVGVFTISMLPVVLSVLGSLFLQGIYYHMPETLHYESAMAFVTFEYVAVVTLLSNSIWNFVIYSARNETFKGLVRKIYGRVFKPITEGSSMSTKSTNVVTPRHAETSS